MMTPADIAEYGERHVEAWLKEQGYHCFVGKPHHGETDIEARGEENTMIVHVMVSLEPKPVPEISTSSRARVVTRAMSLGCDAWLAKVQVGPSGELFAPIEWEKLNH